MRLRFNEAKATQAASRLLQLRGGRMSYVKLIKLLYLVDREALIRWGRFVTTDRHVSTDQGPVVSRIYNLITSDLPPGIVTVWQKHIALRPNYEVELVADPGDDELSRAEEALIDEVFAEHGCKNRWALVDYTHELPEWQDPNGSSIPISHRDILKAANKTDAEIEGIEAELESLAAAQALVSPL
jgi:uncharacterized phage-associated protein